MEPFKFLHTGDLHLDTPFKGLTRKAPAEISRFLREATIRAWERIVDLALEEAVDFVIVAGDVFESADRSLLGQVRFRDGLVRLANARIASFLVTGNHDPLSGWEHSIAWPELAYRFPAEVEARPVLREGREIARVYGISYAQKVVTENLALRFRRDDEAPYAIGVLHTNVGGIPGLDPYSPCSTDDLAAARMDYWALGHIHDRQVLRPRDPVVVYCGNPQGRDLGEQNPRGCYVVSVDAGGRAHPELKIVDVARWQTVPLSIDGIDTHDDLVAAAARVLGGAQSKAGVSIVGQLVLQGRGPLHPALAREAVIAELQTLVSEAIASTEPFIWLDSIRNETRSDLNLTEHREAADFLGEFLRLTHRAKISLGGAAAAETAEARAMVEDSVDGVYGQPRVGRFLKERRPTVDELAMVVDELESTIADKLAGE